MNFSEKKVVETFSSSDSQNVWANIESLGWRKVRAASEDGVTNISLMLSAAATNNKKVSGSVDGTPEEITQIFLH